MRYFTGLLLLALLLAGPSGTVLSAVSLEDLVNLRAQGVSDEVLVALIETDGSVFHLSSADVLAIRKLGLSDQVIVAMIRSGKAATPETPYKGDSPAQPQPEAMPRSQTPSEGRTERSEAPIINVTQSVVQRVESPRQEVEVAVPVYVPVYVRPVAPEPPAAPVYWGFGGQRRADSWEPATGATAPAGETTTKSPKDQRQR